MDTTIKLVDIVLALTIVVLVSTIALSIIKALEQDGKQKVNRKNNLKLQAVRNGGQFGQHNRELKNKLRKYSLSFPRSPHIENISTLQVAGYQSYIFDYAYKHGETYIYISGILVPFDDEHFPQFCVIKHQDLPLGFIGGDPVSPNLLPEWAMDKLTVKTAAKNKQQIYKFLEKDERILDIVFQPDFSWLFVDEKFTLLYLSKQIPANEHYFDIVKDRVIKIIEVFEGRTSQENLIKAIKRSNKV